MYSDFFIRPQLLPEDRPWRTLLMQPAELTVLPCDELHWQELLGHPLLGPMLHQWLAAEPDGDHFLLPLPGALGRMVLIGRWPALTRPFDGLKKAAGWLKRLDPLSFSRAQVSFELLELTRRPLAADALLSACLARQAKLPDYRRETPARPALTLAISHLPQEVSLEALLAEAEGNALSRHLSLQPGSHLSPARYLQRLEQLADEHRWHVEHYPLATLEELGAGAFCAVARGCPDPAQGIIRLQSRREKALMTVALAGKGICFDTGGYNLKGGAHLYGMHQDMTGSATALGSLLAIAQSGLPVAVDCWLAIAENHIGPNAFKPGDLVTALNGTTIEVVDTDAEGRMVLADTLTLASREAPDLLIDYATLTGSCVRAIGRGYSGAFSNQPQWFGELISTGEACGERIWPFPLPDDYLAHLCSDIADIKQCANETSTDHIDAALFLRKFIEQDTPWIHLDLAAAKHVGGLGHITSECTGFGVRFTLAWLQRLLASDQRTE